MDPVVDILRQFPEDKNVVSMHILLDASREKALDLCNEFSYYSPREDLVRDLTQDIYQGFYLFPEPNLYEGNCLNREQFDQLLDVLEIDNHAIRLLLNIKAGYFPLDKLNYILPNSFQIPGFDKLLANTKLREQKFALDMDHFRTDRELLAVQRGEKDLSKMSPIAVNILVTRLAYLNHIPINESNLNCLLIPKGFCLGEAEFVVNNFFGTASDNEIDPYSMLHGQAAKAIATMSDYRQKDELFPVPEKSRHYRRLYEEIASSLEFYELDYQDIFEHFVRAYSFYSIGKLKSSENSSSVLIANMFIDVVMLGREIKEVSDMYGINPSHVAINTQLYFEFIKLFYNNELELPEFDTKQQAIAKERATRIWNNYVLCQELAVTLGALSKEDAFALGLSEFRREFYISLFLGDPIEEQHEEKGLDAFNENDWATIRAIKTQFITQESGYYSTIQINRLAAQVISKNPEAQMQLLRLAREAEVDSTGNNKLKYRLRWFNRLEYSAKAFIINESFMGYSRGVDLKSLADEFVSIYGDKFGSFNTILNSLGLIMAKSEWILSGISLIDLYQTKNFDINTLQELVLY